MSYYSSIITAWSKSFGMQKTLKSSKSRDRTNEASIDNMAKEDSLLSVIRDCLVSFNLLKLLSALATASGQFSIIRRAINTSG